jgi:hypothetical protein
MNMILGLKLQDLLRSSKRIDEKPRLRCLKTSNSLLCSKKTKFDVSDENFFIAAVTAQSVFNRLLFSCPHRATRRGGLIYFQGLDEVTNFCLEVLS